MQSRTWQVQSCADRHAASSTRKMPVSMLLAGGGCCASELYVFQFMMPIDDDYMLEPVMYSILPITGANGPDIAPGSSMLWLAVNGEVRCRNYSLCAVT